MKKLVCFVLAICLLCAAAFAEVVAVDDALQNDMAPEVIARTDEAGNAYYAVIYDAEGNEIEKVTDAALISCVDISARASAEDAVRLLNAYDGLMSGVHFADVACAVHEDTLKDDLPDAFDAVMFELFDLSIAAELAEGSTFEMTFGLLDWQPAPSAVVTSADGIEWSIVGDVVNNGDQTVTVRFAEPGVVAFVLNAADSYVVESTPADAEETSEEAEENLMMGEESGNRYNDKFTPSVHAKPAPGLIFGSGTMGEFVAVIIGGSAEDGQGENEQPVVYIPNDKHLIVTPVSERADIKDILTHEHLVWAYEQIVDAETLATLPAAEETGIGAAVDAVLEGTGLTCDDLVVRDLFEVTAYGEYVEELYDETKSVQMTFDVGMAQDDVLVVLLSADSEVWTVLPAEDVVINADGTVTVRMYDLGAVAFMVEAQDKADEEAVMSPAT